MKNDNSLDKRVREIEDRIALKELVDNFSILADKKDVKTQVRLFTANATAETYRRDVLVTKLSGRKEMEDAFGAFLKNFETVYHFNGQQTVTISGDKVGVRLGREAGVRPVGSRRGNGNAEAQTWE